MDQMQGALQTEHHVVTLLNHLRRTTRPRGQPMSREFQWSLDIGLPGSVSINSTHIIRYKYTIIHYQVNSFKSFDSSVYLYSTQCVFPLDADKANSKTHGCLLTNVPLSPGKLKGNPKNPPQTVEARIRPNLNLGGVILLLVSGRCMALTCMQNRPGPGATHTHSRVARGRELLWEHLQYARRGLELQQTASMAENCISGEICNTAVGVMTYSHTGLHS